MAPEIYEILTLHSLENFTIAYETGDIIRRHTFE